MKYEVKLYNKKKPDVIEAKSVRVTDGGLMVFETDTAIVAIYKPSDWQGVREIQDD